MEIASLSIEELEKLRPITDEKAYDLLYNSSKSNFFCMAYEDGCFVISSDSTQSFAKWLRLSNDVADIIGKKNWSFYCAEQRDVVNELERARKVIEQSTGNGEDKEQKEERGKVKELEAIIASAVKLNASDIHISIRGQYAYIYHRIDGIMDLSPHRRTRKDAVAMIAAAFSFAGAEHSSDDYKSDLDGHTKLEGIVVEVDGKTKVVSARLHHRSLVAGENGDKVCEIRILKGGKAHSLNDLKVGDKVSELLKTTMRGGGGLVLVTGPTGSGKSTMLHAMIKEKPPETVFHTVEDPIEAKSTDPLVFQGNKKESDETADLMRMDPDGVMYGEIRDVVTSKETCSMARTGHLVLATLHANSTVGALGRLLDLGISRAELAEDGLVKLILALRLVPLLCPKCARTLVVDDSESGRWQNWESVASKSTVERLKILAGEGRIKVRNANGCDECGKRGTKGRQMVLEYLVVDDSVRRHVLKGDYPALEASLRERSWQTLQDKGWKLIEAGVCDPDMVEGQIQNTIFDTKREWGY